jgi:ribonuclease HII
MVRAEGAARIAGVDEAGRGPWAGPVVAAAVVLPRGARLDARIDDSKRLSPRQRQRAFELIAAQADVGLGIMAADAIDQSNILRTTLLAMSQAVRALGVPPELVLVDGDALPGDHRRRPEPLRHRLRIDRGESGPGRPDGVL